jgi:glucose-6-phosphate-specific signal transduction histidine kinase
LHCFITILIGSFLAYEQHEQERNRKTIKSLQDAKISLLDEAVKQRTDQLTNIRQVMAADFHDETGNRLSAITRQAPLFKFKLNNNDTALPVAESIIKNSNDLYARSKDFLWNLNHNSDEPVEVFN